MSIAVLPKLPINGLSADEEATRLHFKKNQPDQPDIEFVPYRYHHPYPTCVYRDWSAEARTKEVRRLIGAMALTSASDHWMAEEAVAEFDSRTVGVIDMDDDGQVDAGLRARNEAEHRLIKSLGWVDTPGEVRGQKDKENKALALAAAHRNYEDRNMGELAKREADAIDDAAEDHVAEIKATRKKRGRPYKKAAPAAGEVLA